MRHLLLTVALMCPVFARAQFVTGSGTTNQIPQFTSASTIADSPIRIGANGAVCFGTTQWCDTEPAAVSLYDHRLTDINGNPPAAVGITTACNIGQGCQAIAVQSNGMNSVAVSAVNYADAATGGVGVRGTTVAPNSTGWGAVGVIGSADAPTGGSAGVVGINWSPDGAAGGFYNIGSNLNLDIASGRNTVLLASTNSGPVFYLNDVGEVFTSASFKPGGTDYSAALPVSGDVSDYGAGDLLAVDPNAAGTLTHASEPYSTRVAGVYSTQPGVLANSGYPDLGRTGLVPMAIAGIVPCKVSAENGPIRPGDLLVSSWSHGYAMKGTNRDRMVGAVVGKALEPLPRGKGVIKVLVTLQ